jgi:hypothetical protein
VTDSIYIAALKRFRLRTAVAVTHNDILVSLMWCSVAYPSQVPYPSASIRSRNPYPVPTWGAPHQVTIEAVRYDMPGLAESEVRSLVSLLLGKQTYWPLTLSCGSGFTEPYLHIFHPFLLPAPAPPQRGVEYDPFPGCKPYCSGI